MDTSFESIREKDDAYIEHTYGRFPVAFESGEGPILRDYAGREYIDFTSGIGVNIFGIADPEWKAAVTEQLGKLQHTSNLYYTKPQTELAQLLCEKSGASRVCFQNSGAEANECAIKAARKYNSDRYGEGKRYEILVLENSFHGRTVTTLSATAQPAFHRHFNPFTEGFRSFPADDFGAFERTVSEKTGAVMMELVQGESGVRLLDPGFIVQVAEYCREHDILLIVDEVQTGNGRSGWMYSYQAFGLRPDLVTTAKGLGGGLPIGACLFFEKTRDVFAPGDHGSTFAGNPVCCAGAVSVVRRIDADLLEGVNRKGWRLYAEIGKLRNVEKVSGMGMMIGIKTAKPARAVADRCLEMGLLVLTAHDRVRLLPPLNIDDGTLGKGLNILKEAIEE